MRFVEIHIRICSGINNGLMATAVENFPRAKAKHKHIALETVNTACHSKTTEQHGGSLFERNNGKDAAPPPPPPPAAAAAAGKVTRPRTGS